MEAHERRGHVDRAAAALMDANARLAGLEFLASAEGRALLDGLRPEDFTGRRLLGSMARLTLSVGSETATLAAQLVSGRKAAAAKFGVNYPRWYTAEALEQASGAQAAGHRASRLAAAGSVLELCTGMGGDTLALARAGIEVVSVEVDPLLSRMTALNLLDAGLDGRVALTVRRAEAQPLAGFGACYADPSRRPDGRRSNSLDRLSPDVGLLSALARAAPGFCAKLAPASSLAAVAAAFPGAEAEFVSVGGELKELVVWMGNLASGGRRATILPSGVELAGPGPSYLAVSRPLAYLAEPDPAVIRSGLFAELERLAGGAHYLLADGVAFLTADTAVAGPLARYHRVTDFLPASLGKVGRRLRELGAGRVEVRRRGYPQQAEAVEAFLRPYLTGDAAYKLFLYRQGKDHHAVIAEFEAVGGPP